MLIMIADSCDPLHDMLEDTDSVYYSELIDLAEDLTDYYSRIKGTTQMLTQPNEFNRVVEIVEHILDQFKGYRVDHFYCINHAAGPSGVFRRASWLVATLVKNEGVSDEVR